jgi:hypothetical protein
MDMPYSAVSGMSVLPTRPDIIKNQRCLPHTLVCVWALISPKNGPDMEMSRQKHLYINWIVHLRTWWTWRRT